MAKLYPLGPRLEAEVEDFGHTIQHIPDDLLFDSITAGAGHRDVPPPGATTLPTRWVDARVPGLTLHVGGKPTEPPEDIAA